MKADKPGNGSDAALPAAEHRTHGLNNLPAVAAVTETNAMIPISRLRMAMAMLPPLGALALQWMFWSYIQPYV
jgi:hypothetical protein